MFTSVLAGSALADPADDALAKLNELSRQAEQTTAASREVARRVMELRNVVAQFKI